MSNFFVKSLKEKKNTKSNQSSFNSETKKYKKSFDNKEGINKEGINNDISDIPKNKKKFMITPPNENMYRKKNIKTTNKDTERPFGEIWSSVTDNIDEQLTIKNQKFPKDINSSLLNKLSEGHHFIRNFEKSPSNTFEHDKHKNNENKEYSNDAMNFNINKYNSKYKTSPRKINYSNDDTDTIHDCNYGKNKKILNTVDIKNVLLNNISNSPNMFNVINSENTHDIGNSISNILTENFETKLSDICEPINLANDKNIDNCCKNTTNGVLTNENERYTYINKLNFSSLQKEPTITFVQKDKIKLYNYSVMLDTYTSNFLECSSDSSHSEYKIPCYYCRRNFNNAPLGLPICYYPSIYILKNNSQNLKYSFNYKENTVKLNCNEKERLLKILGKTDNIHKFNLNEYDTEENNIKGENYCKKENKGIYQFKKNNEKDSHKILTKQFFETEGIFCSFNCIVSYLEENRNNPLYQNSYNLIYFMYKILFGYFPQFTIIKSPSWKLRKEYGGPLSDEDYEKYIQNIPIIDTNQFKYHVSKHESIYEVLV